MDWMERVADTLMARHSARAAVVFGSRVYGEALPESDLDVIVVSAGAGEFEATRLPGPESGLPLDAEVDLRLTSPQGAQWSHVMSPEWRQAFFTGRLFGDWSWLRPELPLARQGADDFLGDLAVQFSVATDWGGTHEETVADLVRVLRRELTLEAALRGTDSAVVCGRWSYLADVLGVSRETVDGVRRKARASLKAIRPEALIEIIKGRMEAAEALLRAYPPNEGDRSLAALLVEGAGSGVR